MRAHQLLDSGIMRRNLDLCREEWESVCVRERGLNCIWHTKNWGVTHIIINLPQKQSKLWWIHYTVSLKTYALILFSEVHYLSSCILIYLSSHCGMNVLRWISLLCSKKQTERCSGRTVSITVCRDVCGKINDRDKWTPQTRRDTINSFLATWRRHRVYAQKGVMWCLQNCYKRF